MPSSRAQKLEQNQRRLKEIVTELEAVAETQASSTDPGEQRDLLDQLAALESEQKALQNSCAVLQKELEAAKEKQVETNARIWLQDERPQAEKERDAACKKVLAKIRSLKKEYDKLVEVEKRWKEKWNERGRPQYLNQDRAFVTSARRDIYSFLGMDKRPRMSQTTDQKQIAQILGPTAQIAAMVGAEKRREARKKELIKGVEELRSAEASLETSPPQGAQVEGNESAEKTVNGANE